MKKLTAGLALAGILAVGPVAMAQTSKPTIVLVHGAFADASSWNGVVRILEKDGYPVVAVANPLRSVKSDATYVADIVASIKTPVVLVGHSYGGSVITTAANGHSNVKALVYVSAFAPDAGETAFGLSGKFSGSTLGPSLAPPVMLAGGGIDLYIQQDKFYAQFAADVPESEAKLMAATQRPIAEAAGKEISGDPAWKRMPSWFVYGDKDLNIPPEALAFMAKRAGSKQTVVVKGASHVVMVSNPGPVAKLIENAATASAGMTQDSPLEPELPAGEAGAPYENMPALAPIGARVDRYLPLPDTVAAPPVDQAKGYRLQELGRGLYMITDNAYQSMFMVYETGVVVMDAPPSYAAHIKQAIAEVTAKPVTHVIYSHSHIDHIGGVTALGGKPILIAHEETKRLLVRAKDPNRPVPTVTFKNTYKLKLGSQVLELSYHGVAHEPGNIFIYAPEQKTLMVIDVVFPGWMPWRRFALAQDVPGYFMQVAEIDAVPFQALVGGHVSRVGTHEDVRTQLEFMSDLKSAAEAALKTTAFGQEMHSADKNNPWAGFDNYIDRVVVQCVNAITPKWQSRLAGYDVYIWDQCYAMEQSLRID